MLRVILYLVVSKIQDFSSPLLSYEEKLFESYICLRSDIAKKFGQKKMCDIPRLCRLAIIFYSGYEAALSNTTYVNSILMLQT
jgi:hypothetical protein